MSTKKTPRQSTLVSFFKKTPSQETPTKAAPSRSIEIAVNAKTWESTPTKKIVPEPAVAVVSKTSSDEDEDLPSSTRPQKRRRIAARVYDSDEDYCDSIGEDMDLDAELAVVQPPPKMEIESFKSNQLQRFLAPSKTDPSLEEPSSDMLPSSDTIPALSRERSSRVSAILPKSKQEQLVEGGYDWLKPGKIKDADGNMQGTADYNPRTLYIPKSAAAKFGNFEKQFWEHKSQNFDSIVFFQKGKFYELYEEDAVLAHQLFDWKMSGGRAGSLRMAGVPDYTFDHWAGQFIAKGFRVARVDQMESILGKDLRDRAAGAKKEKIVRRELTQVLTQGSLVDGNMLMSDMSTFLMSIKEIDCDTDHAVPSFAAVFCDAATGTFYFSSFADDAARTQLDTLISQIKPRELVLEKGRMSPLSLKALKTVLSANAIINWIKPEVEFWDDERALQESREARYFGQGDIQTWPEPVQDMLKDAKTAGAFGGLLWYLRNLKLDQDLCSLANFQRYDPLQAKTSLVLDGQSLINLDIFSNDDGGTEGTLYRMVNQCITPFGKRMLKLWVCHPLQSIREINKRLDVIDFLNDKLEVRQDIKFGFFKLPDLERMIARLHCGRCKVLDFVKVLSGFVRVLETLDKLREQVPEGLLLHDILLTVPDMQEKMRFWQNAFDWDTAQGTKDEKGKHVPGQIIPTPGAEAEFDESEANIAKIEADLEPYIIQYAKELKSSKVRYVTLGLSKEIYQIEVPSSIEVPKSWLRLSSTKAVNRYWSPEVKALVTSLQEARELHKALVDGLERRFYTRFDQDYRSWSLIVQTVAKIDCLYSLAVSSHMLTEPNCRPEFIEAPSSVLSLRQLRHACIDQDAGTDFIPNDIDLGGTQETMSLLTGPNMAGKSTLLRSTCMAVILAQLGHYLPAQSARMTAFDQVSVRTGGAKDNIGAAQSTFMTELNETSSILANATSSSLVVLDELGRGTSTFDGMAIACSVLHHLATYSNCLGFFSTHYSNLVEEFRFHPQVRFQNMDFLLGENGRDVTFLYKLVDGICSHSHGLNVARMAGIEACIVEAAARASEWFDGRNHSKESSSTKEQQPGARRMPLGLLMDLDRLANGDDAQEISHRQVDIILEHAQRAVRGLARGQA